MPSVRISWVDSLVGEQGFEIQRTANVAIDGSIIGTAPQDATFFIDTSPLMEDNFYRVRGFNGTIHTAWSDWAHVNIPTITGSITSVSAELIP